MSTSIVTHFLHQGHAYSNKGALPNSATPYAKHIKSTITISNRPLLSLAHHLYPIGADQGDRVYPPVPDNDCSGKALPVVISVLQNEGDEK